MKKTLVLMILLGLLMATMVSAKSLYVITDINAYIDVPIDAYDIQGAPNHLVYQTTNTIPSRNGGAVGLAIDTDSGYLFATFEFSGVMDLINGTTMNRIGQVTAPSALNLAGVVVDQGNQRVYTVDRYTNHLYVYDWDPTGPTLTLVGSSFIALPGVSQAFGIALDETNGKLYVGDYSTSIKVFNTNDWSAAGTYTVSNCVTGIAFDETNQVIYSGCIHSNYLSKYVIGTGETTKLLSSYGLDSNEHIMGVSVDPETGKVYATTGYFSDKLLAIDSNLNLLKTIAMSGDPTGIAIPGFGDISYNPLQFVKEDVDVCHNVGDSFTYTLSFTNTNSFTVTGVNLVDNLPNDVTYVSSSNGGVYNSSGHTVSWAYGPLAAGVSDSVEVIVQANAGTEGTIFTNHATIESDQTPPTTQSDDTNVCQGGGNNGEVPEFGILAILGIVGLAGLFMYRKRQ